MPWTAATRNAPRPSPPSCATRTPIRQHGFLACCALASWADPIGCAAVIEAAAAPDDLVWRGQTHDRFTSQDDTFAHLAEAMSRSRDMVDERGTPAERIEAARSLLRVADRGPRPYNSPCSSTPWPNPPPTGLPTRGIDSPP